MAKTNKVGILKLCKKINDKEGDGTVYSLGSKNANLPIKRWSTGIEDLDNIIGGGMPEGRVVIIWGPEAAGKTTLLYHLFSMHDICLDIPIEGTFDLNRAKVFGNRPKQLLVANSCKCGEDVYNKATQFAKEGIPLIGIDSVPSMLPRADIEKVVKSVNKDSIEEQARGGIARLNNKYLPVVEEIIEVTGTTLIFINQRRDIMNAALFGEKEDMPGGKKLKHASSLTIKVARKQWIKIPNYNPANSSDKETIGMIMKCKVTKSKVCNPMGECEIPLIFERGFVSHEDLKEVTKEIQAIHKVKYTGKPLKGYDLDDYDEEDDYEEDDE